MPPRSRLTYWYEAWVLSLKRTWYVCFHHLYSDIFWHIGATITQIAVRLPSQKYSGPNIAHNLNLTPTENQGLNLDLDSQKHGCGSSRSVWNCWIGTGAHIWVMSKFLATVFWTTALPFKYRGSSPYANFITAIF